MQTTLPRFRLEVVNTQTGEPFIFECQAASEAEASVKANAHGCAVRRIHRVVSDPATERVASWLLSEGAGFKRSLVYVAVFTVLVAVVALLAMP